MTSTITCPECQGEGLVTATFIYGDVDIVCLECGGSGEVKAPTQRTKITCGVCEENWERPYPLPPNYLDSCTLDCPHCSALLILTSLIKLGVWDLWGTKSFHTYMHEQDPRWPADGANTGYMEF